MAESYKILIIPTKRKLKALNLQDDISAIFKEADKDNSGTLTAEEFHNVMADILIRYPQLDLYLKSKRLRHASDLLKDPQGNARKEVDIEGFKLALSQVDSQMKSLPATAQASTPIFSFST